MKQGLAIHKEKITKMRDGGMTFDAIAKEFDVTRQAIWGILNYKGTNGGKVQLFLQKLDLREGEMVLITKEENVHPHAVRVAAYSLGWKVSLKKNNDGSFWVFRIG